MIVLAFLLETKLIKTHVPENVCKREKKLMLLQAARLIRQMMMANQLQSLYARQPSISAYDYFEKKTFVPALPPS